MKWKTLTGEAPLIIAHRGASGYLPEHTLEAYALAVDQGADVIEPDLVFTKDGVLVARHDRYLSTTTNIADLPEFTSRKRANPDPNGEKRKDWWVEDFTLAEIKTLRARQPREGRSKEFDDQYEVPTFKEMLALVTRKAKEAGRPVGVYPETKHPGYFESIGHDFETPLLAALKDFDAGPVFIQSFEPEILKRLKGKIDAKLVQLVYEEAPGAGPNIPLAEIAEYADGVGADKKLLGTNEGYRIDFELDAHNAGLIVHIWTLRDDEPGISFSTAVRNANSPAVLSPSGNVLEQEEILSDLGYAEIYYYFGRGVGGVFTDFPDTAVKARNTMGQPSPK